MVARNEKAGVPAIRLGGVADGAAGWMGICMPCSAPIRAFWLREGKYYHADNAVIVECMFGGTCKAEWAGIAATGRSMEVAAALFFLFEDEGLVCDGAAAVGSGRVDQHWVIRDR
jgi:hypothetical protein